MSKIYVEDLEKEFDTDILTKTFAELEYQGVPLYQIEDAFADGLSDNKDTWVYKAPAIDAKGNRFTVTWKQTNFESEDGADACDWDDYNVKII